MAKPKGNLNVRVGEELLNWINKVAEAMGKSQAEFVKEVLDERTKGHKVDVEEIAKYEKKIAERELSWKHESGQAEVRGAVPQVAGATAPKKRKP